MAKLYPPVIEGSLPAFYDESVIKIDGTEQIYILLNVDFSINAAVSQKEVSGVILKVKHLQESKEIFTVSNDIDINWVTSTATFNLAEYKSKMQIGNFYKIQIAFKDTAGQIGYYSNAGIVKYTSRPELEIEGLTAADDITLNPSRLTGVYRCPDASEKVYSYSFRILNQDGSLYATTGERLHNSELDDSATESRDTFSTNFSFEDKKSYSVQYTVTTINGIKIATQLYSIEINYSFASNNVLNYYKIIPSLNYDQGIIKISLQSLNEGDFSIGGKFQILRASSKDDFKIWYILNRFEMPELLTSNFNYEDNTIEHGITYKYAIQQFNDQGICSNRIYSDKITAEFEDIFLIGDALEEESFSSEEMITSAGGLNKRQLRIRFNPSISNYKRNLQEAKVDTLGNAYPFIFRNGQTKYRSFSIAGIISYISDNEERFIDHKLIEQKTDSTVDLTDENIATERLFRNEVLKWLNNGRVKLFKSPTEGNMIIRLMNVSLSPEKAVGRMIYSFSATAYEMDEYSTDNLIKYDFLNTRILIHKYRKSATVQLGGKTFNTGPKNSLLKHLPAKSIKISLPELTPIMLVVQDDNEHPVEIVTNKTKFYEVSDIDITNVYFKGDGGTREIANGSYFITYEYESGTSNTFSSVTQMDYKDYPMIEMHGSKTDLLAPFQNSKILIDAAGPFRFIKTINQVKVYTDKNTIDEILNNRQADNRYPVSYTKYPLEYIKLENPHFYYAVYSNASSSSFIGYIGYENGNVVKLVNKPDNIIIINNKSIDLTDIASYQLDDAIVASTNPFNDEKKWSLITIGGNITVLFGIKLIINTYSCEEVSDIHAADYKPDVRAAKQSLITAIRTYQGTRTGAKIDEAGKIMVDETGEIISDNRFLLSTKEDVQRAYADVIGAYDYFIPQLEQALIELEGDSV